MGMAPLSRLSYSNLQMLANVHFRTFVCGQQNKGPRTNNWFMDMSRPNSVGIVPFSWLELSHLLTQWSVSKIFKSTEKYIVTYNIVKFLRRASSVGMAPVNWLYPKYLNPRNFISFVVEKGTYLMNLQTCQHSELTEFSWNGSVELVVEQASARNGLVAWCHE